MLYFWVYITFFSWPLILPYLLNTFLPSSCLPKPLRNTSTRAHLPNTNFTITVIAAMFPAVYFNTIIHPFTLADNRHYVFYVFRILLRKPWIRFLAIPVYFLCACSSIITLSGPMPTPTSRPPPPQTKPNSRRHHPPHGPVTPVKEDEETTGPKLSFLLIWLASTSLSLITAPLVEPRYYIIPWIIWRLHVPPTPVSTTKEVPRRRGRKRGIWDDLPHRDYRLYLETVWYLLINVGAGYMFLYKGFAWDQEPGVVQRFMW